MADSFRKGTKVSWKCGNGTASGKIQEIYRETVTRMIKGSEITRNSSDDNPALLIEQNDGDQVLKLQSEVKHAG